MRRPLVPDSLLMFGLLGPLTVEVAGEPVVLPGGRTKAVLAILLAHANSVVSTDRLIDDLWSGNPTPGATATLQGYVSDLRRTLADALGGPAPVLTRRPGYLIAIESGQLDVLRFEQLVDKAKVTRPDQADERARLLRSALDLWRGPALADFADEPFARPVARRLEEARLWALEERVEAELKAGCHGELVTELGALTMEHPLRERLWGQLMLALYRCGRQAEALRTYQILRQRLDEELAIEPSPALRRLEHAILVQDPAIDQSSAAWAPPASPMTAEGGGVGLRVTPSNRRSQLPVKLTRFVGRERELQEIRSLLAGTRLLTIAGAGGSGKTRLAIELAAGEAPGWPDGVVFVDLSSVRPPELVPAAVAASAGLTLREADLVQVCEHLRDAQALLLLDNCEHVIDACAAVVEGILSTCQRVKVLVTTQEELRVGSETVWRVPPLSLPAPRSGPSADPLLASEAVQLFLDRASSPLRGFLDDVGVLDAVAHVCRRLDGIPLAIELAASLVASLPLGEIVRRLDHRLDLLARADRGTVSRHRTLRAAIDWSYGLLSESERELFNRLTIFVGPFTLDAAGAVADDGFIGDLSQLVSKSMVTSVPEPGGSRRYQLLDSLRMYGQERLRASGREVEVHRRHAAYYTSFAVSADRQLHGPEPSGWSTRVIKELPNIRASLEWAFSGGDPEVGVELAGALRCWYFARMGQLAPARAWLETALEPDRHLPPRLRLKALTAAMAIALSEGDYRWGSTLGDEAVVLADELDDPYDLAYALMARGGIAVFEGLAGRALECLRRCVACCEEIGDEWTRAAALTFWGVGSRRWGDDRLARSQLVEALSIFRRLRDESMEVVALFQLALVAQHLSHLDEAMEYCDAAILLARRQGDRQLTHSALCIGGLVELARNRPEQARTLLRSSLTAARGLEHQLMVALAVEGFAVLAHQEARDGEASQLWGFTDALRSRQAMPLGTERAGERERWLAAAVARIGRDEVDRALAEGRRMSYYQVMDAVGAHQETAGRATVEA